MTGIRHVFFITLLFVVSVSLLIVETQTSALAFSIPDWKVRTANVDKKGPSYLHHVARKNNKSASLKVSPTSLSFTGKDGALSPQREQVTISKKSRSKTSVPWKVTTSASWISVSSHSGSTGRETDSITVIPLIARLEPGTYQEMVSVIPTDPSFVPSSIQVTVTVVPADPTIAQTPTAFTFSGQEGASDPASQTLNLMNQGDGSFSWTLVESIPWLTLSANSGTTTNETDTVNLTAQISGLEAGTYSGMVQVQSNEATNSPVGIPITLILAPPTLPSSALLQWSPNVEPDIAGYKVYQGTKPGGYGSPVDVGPVTSHSVENLQPGTTYYFSVTAYDTALNESGFAPEVSISVY